MIPDKANRPAVLLLALVLGARALAPAHEEAEPPGPGRAGTDPFGDPLPDGALARMGTRRLREQGPVLALAFAPDGRTLLSASAGQVHRWEAVTGKEERAWSQRPGPGGYPLAFSPDGRSVAWERGGSVTVWDLDAGELLHELRGHREDVLRAAFSPDGRLLASADRRRTVLLWDLVTGRELHRLTGASALAFSPDGKVLASGADVVRLWDVAAGRELRRLAGSGRGVAGLAFSPDGAVLASGEGDRTVRLWDAATGRELRRLEGLAGEARALAFADGGRTLVAGVSGAEARLWTWDVATGRKLREVGASEEFLTCLAVAPDGKTVATGGVDRAVRLWDVSSGQKLRGGEGHVGGVGALAFSPDGKALATASGAGLGGDHPVYLWETATGKEGGRLLPPDGRQPSSLAFAPDGRTLAVLTGSGALDFWDVAARKLLDGRITDSPSVLAFAYCADGRAVATVAGQAEARTRLGGTVPGTVDARWWDLATRKELHHLGGKDLTGVRSFALSADGRVLIVLSGTDNRFHLWDIPAGKERAAFSPPPEALEHAFSPDARVMAWRGADATVHLLDTATGKEELAPLKTAGPGPASPRDVPKMRLLFAPDGKTLAATLGETISVWDVTTGQELGRWRSDQTAFDSLAFSADGKLLASGGSDGTALVWRVRQPAK